MSDFIEITALAIVGKSVSSPRKEKYLIRKEDIRSICVFNKQTRILTTYPGDPSFIVEESYEELKKQLTETTDA